MCLCLCLCLQVCFLAHAFVNENIKNKRLNCFSWSFSTNVCTLFKGINCPGALGVGFPTQSTRRPVGRRGSHTMLTAGGPPPAANPPGASFPHNPLQYNIIYVQRGASPAAAEIEAVLSFRVDNNENGRVRAAATTGCGTQKTKRCLILFG